MNFLELSKARYSVRQFDENKKVEEEKLQKILEAGRIAPTARNMQNFKILIMNNDLASKITMCTYKAPVVLALAYSKKGSYVYPDAEKTVISGMEDMGIVGTEMALEATDLGLGTCIVNRFSPSETKRILGLEDDYEVVMLLDIGYPAKEAKPSVNHAKRKDLSELVIDKRQDNR